MNRTLAASHPGTPHRAIAALLAALLSTSILPGAVIAVEPAPVLTPLQAPTVPARGGMVLTIEGQNFLFAHGSVSLGIGRMGARRIVPDAIASDHIVVTLPPAGSDSYVPYLAIAPDGRFSNALQYGYQEPILAQISPAASDRRGGVMLTITGSNFTGSFPRVRFERPGTSIEVGPNVVNDSTIVVGAPEWADSLPPVVTVRSHGLTSSSAPLSYTGPRVTGIDPTSGRAKGGIPITIFGQNFGAGASVQIGGKSAPVVTQSQTQIVCTLPPGAGSAAVRVTTGATTSNHATLDYDATPEISFVRPRVGRAGGGTTITLIGHNFGSGAAVTMGGVPCTTEQLDASTLRVVTPGGAAGAAPVVVSTSAGASPPVDFTYLAPPQILSVSPTVVPSDGATLLTISGTNFGGDDPFTVRSATVRDTTKVPVRWRNPDDFRVRMPEGGSGSTTVEVVVDGVKATLASAFTYGAPSGTPAPVITSMIPSSIPRQGGIRLTIEGTNFGTNPTVCFGSVTVAGSSVGGSPVTCTVPAAPAGVTSCPLVVEFSSKATRPVTFSYAPPLVSNLTPSGVPLRGGTVLTISGTSFGAADRVRVRFAGTIETPVLMAGASNLLCNAPASGASGLVPVQVVADGDVSASIPLTYAGPDLASTSVSGVSPAGGTRLTIYGSNFGASQGRVFLGDQCAAVQDWSDGTVVCNAPARQVFFPSEPIALVSAAGAGSDAIDLEWLRPALTSVSPAQGRSSGGTLITIYGSNFTESTVTAFGALVAGRVEQFPDRLHCLTPPGISGPTQISAFDQGTISSTTVGFEGLDAPALDHLMPSYGSTAGGTLITLIGRNFAVDPAVFAWSRIGDGSNIPTARLSADQMRITSDPSSTGLFDVTVSVDSVTALLPGAFYYGAGTDVGHETPHVLSFAAGPTPFASSTSFRLGLPEAMEWRIVVLDVRGARVREMSGRDDAGERTVRWDGRHASGAPARAGVYFARLEVPGRTITRRLVKID